MAARTPVEVESQILLRAEQDIAFRERLIEDPKGVIEAEIGVVLPDDALVLVNEAIATAQKAVPSVDTPLTEKELIQVMGGGRGPNCADTPSGWLGCD